MFSSILLVLGIAVLGFGFRAFEHPISQRLSVACIFASSFLAGYLPSHSWMIGVIVASIWLFLPLIEILTRIRALRLPRDRALQHKRPPGQDLFPNLDSLTQEIEEQGFEQITDVGCDLDSQQQFLRLFHRSSDQVQAAICLMDQGNLAFHYISLMTRSVDGEIFTTWNYPFSYALKFLPKMHILRVKANLPFRVICELHQDQIKKAGITAAKILNLDPEKIGELLQQDLRAQIAHNVHAGLLAPVNAEEVKYTWRGLFYLWLQVLWDFVRL